MTDPTGDGRHRAEGRPAQVVWSVSAYDQQLHAFRGLAGPFVEALCTHSVPAGQLLGDDGRPRCHACLLIYGDELANRNEPTWR